MKRQKVPKKVLDVLKPPPLRMPGAPHPQQQQQQQQKMRRQQQKKGGKAAQASKSVKQLSEDDFESQLNAMRVFTANKKAKTDPEPFGKKQQQQSSMAAISQPAIEAVKKVMREKKQQQEKMLQGKKTALQKCVEKEFSKARLAAEKPKPKPAEKLKPAEKSKTTVEKVKVTATVKPVVEKEKPPVEKVKPPVKAKAVEKPKPPVEKPKPPVEKPKPTFAERAKYMSAAARKQTIKHAYQSAISRIPNPAEPRRRIMPSLVESSEKGNGNMVGVSTAKKITDVVAGLMNQEATRRRDVAIEGALADLDHFVSMRKSKKLVKAGKSMKYSITSKALKLRKLQKKVRSRVLAAQGELQVMKTKEFYKTARQIASKKIELIKQADVEGRNLSALRHKELRRGKQNWLDMVGSSQDKIRSNTKRLMQFHAKLSGDFNKVEKEDRRKRMLRALESKDAEAYANLVREGIGGVASADKNELEQLTKFLDDTEKYLADLGDKVKLVKLQAAVDEGDIKMADTITKQNDEDDTGGNKLYDAAHSLDLQIQLPHLLSEPGLRSYQVTGLKWMTSLYRNHLNGILADEMGLGKTVQVISLFAWLMEYKSNMGPHLVIVPNAVVPNWRNELKRWFPTATTCVYIGNKEQRGIIFNAHVSLEATYRSNVVITTYEFALRDKSKLSKVDWKYVVMDEAHRIKDRTSKLADAVDRLQCERRLLLTGTPLQNDLQELWSLLNYLLPKVFDDQSKKAFREWFDEHLSNQQDVTEEKLAKRAVVIQRLHQALEPFMLRRQVEDVEQSLPPKVPHTILCALSSLESVAYRWIAQTATVKDIRGGFYAINNKAMELKKLCNHLIMAYPEAVLDHSMTELIRSSGKLFMLDRILMKMYKSGHRVLLFSTMTKALDILQTYVKWRGWGFGRIDGTTPIDERELAIANFNQVDGREDGSEAPFIFLLSIRAAGRGLNLQSSDTVILYDPDPNPKNEEQAIARSHRIGQVREVRVFHLETVVDSQLSTASNDDDEEEELEEAREETRQGRGGYEDSIESITRRKIQKYKIDMANEVIDAGRFDLESSKEEKRKTLQTLLQEHTTSSGGDNYVVGMSEINRLIARNPEEIKMYNEMDKDSSLWPGPLYTSIQDVPSWLHFETRDIEAAHEMMGVKKK